MEPMELEAIKARVEKATKGPWYVITEDEANRLSGEGHRGPQILAEDVDMPWWVAAAAKGIEGAPEEDNAQFMAHARTDVPALIKACEILQKGMDEIRTELNTTATEDRSLALWSIGQAVGEALSAAAEALTKKEK